MCYSGFFAATRKKMHSLNPRQNEKRHRIFSIKRYTVTVNGISVSPSWFCCRFMYLQSGGCALNWREINGIPLFGSYESDIK